MSSSNGRGGHRNQQEDDDEEDDLAYEKTHVDSVAKYEGVEDWEHAVDKIDTIERASNGKLVVYLTM